jgi:phage terminase small subunit
MSLRNPRYERFAQGLAEGKPACQAYIDAGFAKAGAAQSASRLLKNQRAGIGERVAEILQEREQVDAEWTKLAIERTAITLERVAVELGRIGFANMGDYMRVGPSGDPVLDFSKLTRERAAALTEVTVDDYLEGRGETAREVRKVKFKLADKRGADGHRETVRLDHRAAREQSRRRVRRNERRADRGVAGRARRGPREGAASRHRGGAAARRHRDAATDYGAGQASLTSRWSEGSRRVGDRNGATCDASLGRRIRA